MNKVGNLANDWHASATDHRYICFQTGNLISITVHIRARTAIIILLLRSNGLSS
jgi:YD repeat-containing protein